MPEETNREKFDKFDEYKFFVDDTAKFSERRQGVTNTYITVNSAILGLGTFLVTDSSLSGWKLILACLPVIAAGILICYFWYRLLITYKRLLGFRFRQLEEMEKQIDGCHKMYTRESDELYARAPQKQQIGFSKVEARLPYLFVFLYVIFLAALILASL